MLVLLASTACGGGGGGDETDGEGGGDGDGAGSSNGNGSGNVGGGSSGACGSVVPEGDDKEDVVDQLDGVEVTTLAGTNTEGTADGVGPTAGFSNPVNVLLDAGDTLLVADYDSGRIRVATDEGAVDTLTSQASFQRPFGLVWTMSGKLLVQTDFDDTGTSAGPAGGVIWEVDTDTGVPNALVTDVGRPRGMATLTSGEVILADIERHDIRKFNPESKELTQLAGQPGCSGFADGDGPDAQFDRPYGMVVLSNGDILVADMNNHRIRKIKSDGSVSTYAGDGVPDMIDGDLSNARFNMPKDLAVDGDNNVYVSDTGNHRIRRIRANGTVETIAGDGTAGYADGDGGEARFFGQEGLDVTPDGKTLYLADGSGGEIEPYHRVRKITLP